MSSFTLDTPEGLEKFEAHLSSNKFVNGDEKTQSDDDLAKTIGSAPDSTAYPNVNKWFNQVNGDDDVDLFAEETEEDKLENEKRAQKLKETKKSGPVLRSAVVLDVKPEGSETDLDELEAKVREIAMEGLEWKASERINIGFGVKKLRIMCYVVDELVSTDSDVIPIIESWEDYVQSVDVHSFSKI